MERAQLVVNVSALTFIVASMLAMGMSYSVKEMVAPLKRTSLVIKILLANFVIVPLAAFVVLWFIPIDEPFKIGLILIAMAAGAPFIPRLAERAKGDVGFSVGLMALLMIVTVVFLPIVLPLVLTDVQVNAWDIARPLIFAMLIPLGIGLLVKKWASNKAVKIAKVLSLISTIALVLLIVSSLIANTGVFSAVFGTGAILTILIMTAVAIAIGYFLGGSDKNNRKVVALGTGQRNLAAAMVVAMQNFADPNVFVMVIAGSLIIVITLLITARIFGKISKESQPTTSPETI